MKAGLRFSPGLNARGWLNEGEEVPPERVSELIVEIPIVCVMWRVSLDSPYGHVGLVMRHQEDTNWLLGGNQGIGQVNIQPFGTDRVLGYRRLWG